jgi:hypothetical protein
MMFFRTRFIAYYASEESHFHPSLPLKCVLTYEMHKFSLIEILYEG